MRAEARESAGNTSQELKRREYQEEEKQAGPIAGGPVRHAERGAVVAHDAVVDRIYGEIQEFQAVERIACKHPVADIPGCRGRGCNGAEDNHLLQRMASPE